MGWMKLDNVPHCGSEISVRCPIEIPGSGKRCRRVQLFPEMRSGKTAPVSEQTSSNLIQSKAPQNFCGAFGFRRTD
jgi:hypothetical protein